MAADKIKPGLYKTPALRPPTLEDLGAICDKFGIRRDAAYLTEMKGCIEGFMQVHEAVDAMVEPTLPVKYPRIPGYRPEPEENKYNAWYWRCDIPGASKGLLKDKAIAIKDNICVSGVPMMNGTQLLEHYVPDIDATVVTRILDAGGRITGKTNCEQLCSDVSSWSNATGPTLNPYDVTRSAGGSSGGSAVVVQTGDADMALGGDQGGSIRIPSSFCGIVGLKPTWGLVPCTGAAGFDMTIDHVGPMARTVADCAVLLEGIAGYEEDNDGRQSRDLVVPKYSQLLTGDISGMKIGLVSEGFGHCEEIVQRIVRDAAEGLVRCGATVEEFSLPQHTDGHAVWTVVCNEGIYQTIARRYGANHNYKGFYATGLADNLRKGFQTKANDLSDTMVHIFLAGEYISQNYGNKFYAKAQNLRLKLTKAYNKALETYDALIMPTVPYVAPPLPTTESTVKERLDNAWGPSGILFKNTGQFDLSGHPVISVNAGWSEGLPVGMQIIGKHFDEVTVLQIARAVEKNGEECSR